MNVVQTTADQVNTIRQIYLFDFLYYPIAIALRLKVDWKNLTVLGSLISWPLHEDSVINSIVFYCSR